MDQDSFVPMTPPNNFVKELRGVLDQQNILSAKTKQKGKMKSKFKKKVAIIYMFSCPLSSSRFG